jgi:host factor-I protein
MSARPHLQDAFLTHLNEKKVPVTVYLLNGIKLQGFIDWFDRFSVVLHRDGRSQLVYKSTISTIVPMTAVKLFEGESSPRQI